MFQLDTGSQGGEGPWIAWSARGTLDGTVPAKSFFIREGSTKTQIDAFAKGVVLDIHALKTGWQRSDGTPGQAPEWRWNPSPAQMQASPGDDWKKGFSVRCALGSGQTAVWEQSGAAVWDALVGLVPALQQAPDSTSLPLVRLTSTKLQQFKKGSTVSPVLEVVKWVPRPDCLKDGIAAGFAAEPAPAPAPKAAAQPAPAPQPVMEDDLEF
jgi:hypothetical protein